MNGIEACEPRELVGEVERLLEQLETLSDPAARQTATEVVRALLDLYGAGLERIVQQIAARDDGELTRALANDELASHLLLLHGLHPVSVEDRVAGALMDVRPYLQSHGGDVELLGLEGAAVRLRLQGSCSGCPSSRMTLKLAIEDAIHKSAPEIEEVIAQEEPSPSAEQAPLLQIELMPGLGTSPPPDAEEPSGSWVMAGGLPELNSDGALVKRVGGQRILFLRLAGRLYGYYPSCPSCGQSLAEGTLAGAELSCAGCGNRYDAMRAGRCLDSPVLHLDPVPLLVGEDGLVRVALAVAA